MMMMMGGSYLIISFTYQIHSIYTSTHPNVIILSQAKKLNKRLKRVGLTVSLRGIKVDIIIIVTMVINIIVIVTMVINIIIVAVADTIIINIVVINAILILQVVECDSGLPTMDYSIYRYLDILPMMLDTKVSSRLSMSKTKITTTVRNAEGDHLDLKFRNMRNG